MGLWVYDLKTLAPIALWETERGLIVSVAFSPNGKWIATYNLDNIIKVLDVQKGICISQVKTDGIVYELTFSDDNRYLAASYGSSAMVEVWHAETCKPVAQYTLNTEETSYYCPVSFSPCAELIVSTGPSSTNQHADEIVVWNVESAQQIASLPGHTDSVTTLSFSPCGELLASGGEDGTVYVWDVNTWQIVESYTDFGGLCSTMPSWTPDGILRATITMYDDTNYATISVRDLESNEQIYTDQVWGSTKRFSDADDWGNFKVFSNGSQLAYESRHEFVTVWTPEYPYKRQFTHSPISFPAYECTSISFPTAMFSDDGKTLAVKYHHEGVVLWDIESRRSQPAVNVETAGKNQFLYKTDSGKLYVASIKDDNVKLWEADGNGIPLIEGTGREYWGAFPALSPTGEFFAYVDELGKIKVWDVQSGNQLYEIEHPLERNDEGDDDSITDLQFSFDGKILASKSQSTSPQIILWDVELGEMIETSPNNTATSILGMLVLRHLNPRSREVVHISHDGKYLSSHWQ